MIDQAPRVQELKAPALDFFVWIEVDGVKADLHATHTEGKVVCGYVEGRVGAEVALCFRNGAVLGQLPHAIGITGHADGSEFAGLFCPTNANLLGTAQDDPDRTDRFTGTRISPDQEKKLVLVPLNMTNDKSRACLNADILNGVGTIKLELTWGQPERVPAPKHVYPKGPKDQVPFHRTWAIESDIAYRTRLGGVQEADEQERYYWTEIRGPFVEFEFYYRSRDMLLRRGLMAPPCVPGSPMGSVASGSSTHSPGSEIGELDEVEPEYSQNTRKRMFEGMEEIQREANAARAKRLRPGRAGSVSSASSQATSPPPVAGRSAR